MSLLASTAYHLPRTTVENAKTPSARAGGAFMPLRGRCFSARLCTGGCAEASERYDWTLCPFGEVSQTPVSASGGGRPRPTSLGRFAGWSTVRLPTLASPFEWEPRSTWLHSEGERCWDGPPRSVRVELRCAPESRLVAVEEDGKCAYLMLF